MHVVMVALRFSNNQMGRVNSLYLALRALGHTAEVITLEDGRMWPPLVGSELASHARAVDAATAVTVAQGADVIVAVKALPHSLGVAAQLAEVCGKPLVADVDDPDIEAMLPGVHVPGVHDDPSPVPAQGQPAPAWVHEMLGHLRRVPVLTSNPVLQAKYGGVLVPHARPDLGAGAPHERTAPRIAFVGTPQPHKGIDTVRAATAALSSLGWTLSVTGAAPADARPWETWTGDLPYPEALRMLAGSDVVVLPSAPVGYGAAQLPMKLVDAMMFGRGIVVSDTGPLPWALGDGGFVVPHGDHFALVERLLALSSPQVRTVLGGRARQRALELFTPGAVALAVGRALDEATSRQGAGSSRRQTAPA